MSQPTKDNSLCFPPSVYTRSASNGTSPPPSPTPCTLLHLSHHSNQLRNTSRHLSRLRLHWPPTSPPRNFLLLPREWLEEEKLEEFCDCLCKIIQWLAHDSPAQEQTVVWTFSFLRSFAKRHDGLGRLVDGLREDSRLHYWDERGEEEVLIDLLITLGGDGTVLNGAWQFQHIVPPLIPFHAGSLGFLNLFPLATATTTLGRIIQNGCRLSIRMRLECQLRSATPRQYQVLNEVVVDRGAGQHMCNLEVEVEGHGMTVVQADGLIVATPTGSTAYSMSAGGSVAHPQVPAILLTPICPHSLSFRPLIFPDSVEIVIRVGMTSRGTAWASFDGRERVELLRGDSITISSSNYPVPTVCLEDSTVDWSSALSHCLRWNDRPAKSPLN